MNHWLPSSPALVLQQCELSCAVARGRGPSVEAEGVEVGAGDLEVIAVQSEG